MFIARLVLGVVLIIIIAQLPVLHDILAWDRTAILSGQWWRIITGNLTHSNYMHMIMNLAGLIVLVFLHHSYYKGAHVLFMIWVMMLAIGIVMFFTPFSWYVGLSGVLYGLLVWGAIKDIQCKVPLGWLLLIAVFGKLIFDTYYQDNALTVRIIEVSLAYQAHWTGALVGLLFALYAKNWPKSAATS